MTLFTVIFIHRPTPGAIVLAYLTIYTVPYINFFSDYYCTWSFGVWTMSYTVCRVYTCKFKFIYVLLFATVISE